MENVKTRILLKNVTKTYEMANQEKLDTLIDVNLRLEDEEFVSIIGPSGCGKSTLFRLIAKLEEDYEGEILLNNISLQQSNELVSYMQQKDLLMPWRKVLDNVILPLELKGMNRQGCYKTAQEYLEDFGLSGFEHVYPGQLSGGMRQRAALLRTYLINSPIMLLDEPFGALDAITRSEMQNWLLKIWQTKKKSVLFITHDVDEAIYLSDRIYIMSERPGTMIDELKVDFERPRNPDFLTTQKYLEYKKRIINRLH